MRTSPAVMLQSCPHIVSLSKVYNYNSVWIELAKTPPPSSGIPVSGVSFGSSSSSTVSLMATPMLSSTRVTAVLPPLCRWSFRKLVLFDSPMRVQNLVANLVARMAKHDPDAQEEFAGENAITPLVSLLSIGVFEKMGWKSFDTMMTTQNQNQRFIFCINKNRKSEESTCSQ
ncbi:hypothetical protein NE237_001311 [Protea cynaroides]|uniref:Uncharacterized protein n=1 Tax=Protea cynaroides TaxID=273540 RepID=A0A9Q0KT25_9MAGN|nr:hypothetical protein NE237_001311 [Protea cynaroides]